MLTPAEPQKPCRAHYAPCVLRCVLPCMLRAVPCLKRARSCLQRLDDQLSNLC